MEYTPQKFSTDDLVAAWKDGSLKINEECFAPRKKRSDLVLSTLRKTVEAIGGNLSLVAEFPDHAPVALSGIAEDDPRPKRTSRRRVA